MRATATDAAGNTSADSSSRHLYHRHHRAGRADGGDAGQQRSTTPDTTPTFAGLAEAGLDRGDLLRRLAGRHDDDRRRGRRGVFTPTTPLADGAPHRVGTATDTIRNASGVSRPHTFTVDATAPAIPVLVTPVDGSATADATPSASGHAEGDAIGRRIRRRGVPGHDDDHDERRRFHLHAGDGTGRRHARDAGQRDRPERQRADRLQHERVHRRHRRARRAGRRRPRPPTARRARPSPSPGTPTRSRSSAASTRPPMTPGAPARARSSRRSSTASARSRSAPQTRSGNRSAAYRRTWTLDTTEPAPPAVTSGPDASSAQTSATFEFNGEPGATVECRVDGGAWTACTSGKAYDGLAVGEHAFDVRATNAAGTTSAPRTARICVAPPTAPWPRRPAPPRRRPRRRRRTR